MTSQATGGWWRRTPIRTRLAIVLSIALAPVLVLGAVQSVIVFTREASEQQAELVSSVERGAASVNARIVLAGVLLRSLAPVSRGPNCAAQLADARKRFPDYANLIRFDPAGSVACAAAPTPDDPQRRERPWFRDLAVGTATTMTLTSEPGAAYAGEPTLLANIRADDEYGREIGVLSAVMTLASLAPEKDGRFMPAGSEVALVDRGGRFLIRGRAAAFPEVLGPRLSGKTDPRSILSLGQDRTGAKRIFIAAPLADADLDVVLSAPYRDVLSWAWLNPVSAVGLPLLAFILALAGVWIVADRGVVRWVAYLQRFAAIYAHGRYTVHPDRAKRAPPEIRELAETLDSMASALAIRDRALRESLVQKDGLMREIHHRVKNNLQVISSLLNMQQRTLADPAARAAISDTRQRISALALIYRALYEGPDLRKVDLREFLEDLIAQLIMNEAGDRPSIRTEFAIDSLTIDPDHLAPLALFAVEAITNAKKHGLARSGARLAVRFRVRGATAELAITDSGRPDQSPAVVGEGVGRTLMLAFARQLGGDVSFRPEPEGGMTACLTFPIPASDSSATV